MATADNSWVFDSLICFLNGPMWNVPIQSFIEEKCAGDSILFVIFVAIVLFKAFCRGVGVQGQVYCFLACFFYGNVFNFVIYYKGMI